MQIDPINIYKNKNALVLFGGNSSSQYLQYLKNINKDENILIVDSGVISKTLYNYKIFPNYIFSPFSEKLKWNYLHNVIYRLLLFNLSPEKFLKKEYKDQINFVRSNFDNFFEIWKPEKGVHKKYKDDNKCTGQSKNNRCQAHTFVRYRIFRFVVVVVIVVVIVVIIVFMIGHSAFQILI